MQVLVKYIDYDHYDVKTTVSISKNTRERLASIGNKDSTFDEIIQKLIKVWEHDNG